MEEASETKTKKLSELLKEKISDEEIVKMIYNLNEFHFDKYEIGEYFGGSLTANTKLLSLSVHQINCKRVELVAALRTFMSAFILPSDPTKITKILESFAKHYYSSNSEYLKTVIDNELVYSLCLGALILSINLFISGAINLKGTISKNPRFDVTKISKEDFANFFTEHMERDKAIFNRVYDQIAKEKENKLGDLSGFIN